MKDGAGRAGRRSTLLAAVPVLLVVAVVGTGLGATALQSLGLMPLTGRPRLSIAAYTDEQREVLTATGLSLLIASASTVAAAVVGMTTAVLAMGSRRARRLLTALVTATVPVPHLVGAASVGLLLADGGLLSRWLGTPESWPSLVAGRWPTAIVVEYAWKESAFIALVVTATLAARLPAYQETAALLGADARARFRHVTIPLAAPALGVSSAITFVYTLGSYEVAWLLGPAYPEPLPVMAYRLFTSTDLAARPEAMALAMTTTGLAAVAAVVALTLVRRTAAWR